MHTCIHTYTHAYIHTWNRKRHTKDGDDSYRMPFEDRPAFGITPADDQYIFENQALDWSEGALAFGEDAFDEHAFDEYMLDEHV